MSEIWFWAAALGMGAAVAVILLAALRRHRTETLPPEVADLAIYKDQLAEIDRDLARGTIGTEEAERLRAEVARRLLEADRGMATAAATGRGGWSRLAMVAVVATLVPGTAAVYWGLGAPGYPDMPLGPRLADLDAAIAARPSQAQQLERLGLLPDPAADTTLRAELEAIADVDALRARYRDALLSGDMHQAVRVQERVLALVGADSQAQDHADLALALVLEAEGYVSPEAEVQLRETLQRNLGHELARYLVGEMFLQGGRFDQAFSFWRPILEQGNPDAPWMPSIRDRIQMVADLAGVRYEAPGAGPTSGDMAAAADMTPEERMAMIEGMVAQLSERLATEGGDVEDWERLIRSLVVLERLPEAQAIYDEAKEKFQGRPAELSFLRMAAVEGGLSP